MTRSSLENVVEHLPELVKLIDEYLALLERLEELGVPREIFFHAAFDESGKRRAAKMRALA